MELEAIASDESKLAVIVPGISVDWVSVTSVISERVVPGASSRLSSKVKSLVVDVPFCTGSHRQTEISTLMELLAIIGEPLKRLHLPAMRLEMENLEHILSCCPNLTELNVSGHNFSSLSPLVDAYASERCKIRTLSCASTLGPWDLQGEISRELTELIRGPAGSILQGLKIHAMAPPLLADGDFILRRQLSFLDKNVFPLGETFKSSSIEFIQLSGFEKFCHGTGYFAGHERTHEEKSPLCLLSETVLSRPLSSARKTAFLSCVHLLDSMSIGRLDSAAIGQVFSFAVEPFVQRVIKSEALAFAVCKCTQ